ncbi:hypothetical protein GCM10020000_30410 [Streptomyces olivoverticillatus]
MKIAAFSVPRGNIIVGGQPITGSAETGGDLRYKRTFKDGAMYAPITGFASQGYGMTGLESLNSKLLSGTDDRLFLQRTSDMLTGKKTRGGDVVTTIDPKAQKAAYEGLGNRKGAVVALDPRTGKILALASTPSYDPSVFAGLSAKDKAAWDALEKDKDKPTLNRALKEVYPPGSTFKIVTASAALENGLYSDINGKTDSPDPWTMPGTVTTLPNQNPTAPCKDASLNVAMQHSCNNVYGKVAADLGKDKMRQTAEKFGFNDAEVDTPVRAAKSTFPDGINQSQTALAEHRPGQPDRHPAAGRHGHGGHRQRRQADEAVHGRGAARPGPHGAREAQAGADVPGRLRRHREEGPADDGGHRDEGHRQGRADRRRDRRRQDRHRRARQGPEEPGLVHLLRQAGRRLARRRRGRGGPGRQRAGRRDLRRQARGPHRQEGHAGRPRQVTAAPQGACPRGPHGGP